MLRNSCAAVSTNGMEVGIVAPGMVGVNGMKRDVRVNLGELAIICCFIYTCLPCA